MNPIIRKVFVNGILSKLNFGVYRKYNGSSLHVPVINGVGLPNIKLSKDWMLLLLKELTWSSGDVFVDVGVNIGQTLIKFRSLYPNTYYGFEPNPNCLFYVDKLIHSNKYKEVHILPIGLSNSTGMVKFFTQSETDSSATIVEGFRGDLYKALTPNYIPVFKFDELNEIPKERIRLIKVDVEGAELEVVSGMQETLRTFKPILQCEILDYHEEGTRAMVQDRANKLMNVMQQLGYSAYRVQIAAGQFKLIPVSQVSLKLWSHKSLSENDYLFVHSERMNIIKQLIQL